MKCLIWGFLFMALTFAQDATQDPGGWTKVKWGMTEVQIKKTFPEATQVKTKSEIMSGTALGLAGFLIGDEKFTVCFLFDDAGALRTVIIAPENKHVTADGKEFSGPPNAAALATKVMLLEHLTDKYGKPTQVAEEPSEGWTTHEWEWLFPRTKIILDYTTWDSSYHQPDSCALFYRRRQTDSPL